MLESLLRAFFGSFFSTLGFAFLLRTPKQSWLVSSLIGAIGYTLYTLLIHFGVSEPASMFAGMLAASLLAHFAARRMRMIATIFLTLSIIPCPATCRTCCHYIICVWYLSGIPTRFGVKKALHSWLHQHMNTGRIASLY